MTDGPYRILILDDEEQLRNLLKENLEEQGYTCFTAQNGQAGLDVLSQEPVDLAVVDIKMPGMSGLSFFQQLKEEHPEVAAIFVTAVDDLNLAVEHLKHGAYDYLIKPVPLKRMRQAVRQALISQREKNDDEHFRCSLQQEVTKQAEGLEARDREIHALNRLLHEDLNKIFDPRDGAVTQY